MAGCEGRDAEPGVGGVRERARTRIRGRQGKGLCQVGRKDWEWGWGCVIDGGDLCLGRCCLFGYRRCGWGWGWGHMSESECTEIAEAALHAHTELQQRCDT